MADEYVCSLDEASLKVAQEELHEDPKERMGQVETLRQWILQQPHLKANTETKALLPFLRTAKFSQLKARAMIEQTLKLRTEIPEWFCNIDVHDQRIKNFLSSGYVVKLPGRLDGQIVLLFRTGCLDLTNKHYDKLSMMKAMSAMFQTLLQDEATQVYGMIFLYDMTSTPSGMISYFGIEDLKKLTKMWEGTFPGRMKGFHYYNTGAVFESLMAISRPLLSKKMQSRIKVHGDNLESVYKVFPKSMLPDEYLPDDYTGPSAGPHRALVDKFVEEITTAEWRNHILKTTSSDWGIDESKRIQDTPQESFRKLNLD